jgi:hypothetical protein
MGEQDIIKPLNPFGLEFGQEMRHRSQGSGIDEKSKLLALIKPGTDKLSKTLKAGFVKIDTT